MLRCRVRLDPAAGAGGRYAPRGGSAPSSGRAARARRKRVKGLRGGPRRVGGREKGSRLPVVEN
jgi:hypothetical protein